MRQRRIPDSVRIWIGQIDSRKWRHGWHRHAATLTWPHEAPPKPFRKNVQTTVFGAGRLFVFSLISYLPDYQLGPTEAHVLPQLWPPSADPWPPQWMLGDPEADRLAAYFDQVLRRRNVHWRPEPLEDAT
jgi:hypothetical protein